MQRARSELFTMALEIEQRSHHHVQKLLTAVSLLLQQTSACLHDRMVSNHDILALSPPVDIVWAIVIVWRIRGKNYQNCSVLCCVQLCTIIDTHMNSFYS